MNKIYGITVAVSALAAAVLSLDAHAQTSREAMKAEAAASAPAISSNRQGDQTASKPVMSSESRASKKAEAAAARTTGSNRVGEQTMPSQSQGAKPRPSAESRADVKAGAVAANKPGGDKPTGEASQKGQDKGVTKP